MEVEYKMKEYSTAIGTQQQGDKQHILWPVASNNLGSLKFCLLSSTLNAITFHHHPIVLSFQNWNSIKFGSMCYLLLQQGPQTQVNASHHECVKLSRMFLFLHNTFTLIQIHQGKLVVNKQDFLK